MFKSAIFSFFLFILLVFWDRRFILPILLITPVIETILIVAEGLTVTKLLAAFLVVYFIVGLILKKGTRVDKNTMWLLSFLLMAVLGMLVGFFEVNTNEISDAFTFNLITVFPKIRTPAPKR